VHITSGCVFVGLNLDTPNSAKPNKKKNSEPRKHRKHARPMTSMWRTMEAFCTFRGKSWIQTTVAAESKEASQFGETGDSTAAPQQTVAGLSYQSRLRT
jgi:hypothetical protein